MYATAAARSDGLLLLCGGRDAEGTPLGDAFGLARHRDGRWEWAAAPGELQESPRLFPALFEGYPYEKMSAMLAKHVASMTNAVRARPHPETPYPTG